MVSLNFYLKNKKAKNKSIILLFLSFQNERTKVSTGLTIVPKFWNHKKQRAKTTMPGALEFNRALDKKVEKVMKLDAELNSKEGFSIQVLKEYFLAIKKTRKKRISTKKGFHWFVKKYIAEIEFTKSEHTFNRAKAIYKLLMEFETWRGKRIEFQGIDMEFYYEMQKYYLHIKQYSNNYFGLIVKVLKTILNDATEKGYNKNLTYNNKKFKRPKEDVDNIYLSRTELDAIYRLDLSKEEASFGCARDLFIIACFTGLRFSDCCKLSDSHFINGQYIQMKTQKTNDNVVIPLHPYVKAIRQKYKDNSSNGLPPSFSNPTMNKLIKEIGKLAGINNTVTVTRTKGGKRYDVTRPKYGFIVTHTARRSFATNAFLAEIPTISIMKITGHRTEKAFMKYIKISQEDNARKLLGHTFFNS